jgi:hypothetical protein
MDSGMTRVALLFAFWLCCPVAAMPDSRTRIPPDAHVVSPSEQIKFGMSIPQVERLLSEKGELIQGTAHFITLGYPKSRVKVTYQQGVNEVQEWEPPQ